MKTSPESKCPDPFPRFRYEQKQWIINPVVAYRAIATQRYYMDVFAGARVLVLEADLTRRFARGDQKTRGADTTWADPVIGMELRW